MKKIQISLIVLLSMSLLIGLVLFADTADTLFVKLSEVKAISSSYL